MPLSPLNTRHVRHAFLFYSGTRLTLVFYFSFLTVCNSIPRSLVSDVLADLHPSYLLSTMGLSPAAAVPAFPCDAISMVALPPSRPWLQTVATTSGGLHSINVKTVVNVKMTRQDLIDILDEAIALVENDD